jgi:uncharacterized protein YndB with AHSA1/START domain
LIVRTRWSFASPPARVWSLLCNSRMDNATALLFRLGVPHPIQCRILDETGGPGTERECVSDQGVVHQRILEWVPERRLAFRMEATDMEWGRHVRELSEAFDLVPVPGGVEVTRTSQVRVTGRAPWLRMLMLYLSLKQVHRYVFRNWKRLAEANGRAPDPDPRASSAELRPGRRAKES